VLNTAIAVISLITTVVVLSMAWRFFHNEPPWLEARIDGLLGTFFEPGPEGTNLIDMIGERLGASIKGGLMGHKSGEARHEKMLEKRVFGAVLEKSPELQIGMKALESFGLGDLATPENLPALLSLANKYGLFNLLKGNSPGESRSGVM
jgi:hypothetical protein